MSVLDKIAAAVAPPESDEARSEARERARAAAVDAPWLETILDHHMEIEQAFLQTKKATGADSRRVALKALGVLLTGHSIAEEAAVYPAIAKHGEKAAAVKAYTEQQAAKLEMGLLEDLDPDSEDWKDKLEHIEGAVQHHVYEEEGKWYSELALSATPAENSQISERYDEHYNRYVGAKKVF